MGNTTSKMESYNLSRNKINIFYMLMVYILPVLIIKDMEKYSTFVSIIYATFLTSMGCIILKNIEFNIDRLYIIQGIVLFIVGVLEYIQLLIIFTGYNKLYILNEIRSILLLAIDILPLFGIYISFKYIKKDKNIFKDLILFISILLLIILNIKIYIYKELIINIFILVLGYRAYISLKDLNNYLDTQERYLLRRMIIIISLSRIPYLYHTMINSIYIEYILSNIIKGISTVYLYKYISYSIFYKPYIKLDEANSSLISKNNFFKEQNIKLIEETKKVEYFKEIFESKENKLKSILDTSTNCIIVFNNKKEIVYLNKKFREKLLCTKEKIINYDNYLKNTILNYEMFINCINDIICGKSIVTNIIKSSDNKIYQATFSSLIIQDKIQGVLCVLTDKTNKIESGRKIKELNNKYIKFLESIGDGIIVLQDNKKIYVNKACKNILKDMLHNIDFTKYNKSSKVEDVFEINKKNVYVEMEFYEYTKNEEDKTIVIIRDISSRKNAQNKLKNNQKSYSEFIDILPDGICLIDKNLKIKYANKSLLQMLEVNYLSEIYNLSIKDFINLNKEQENIFNNKISKVTEENKNMVLLDYSIVTYKKNKVQVEFNALPFYDDESNIMLIIKDLTYKKISEMAEKEILDRFKADKIKTEFFANMSHELKTPLNVIYSSNQLLESNYKNKKIIDYNDNIKYHIDLVKQSSYRIQRLIGNIIDLTKMESGHYNIKLSKHNIVSVIEDLFMKIEKYSSKKDISIIFDTDNEEIYTYIDKPEIERIILNLLANCIKFTPNGGEIKVNIYDKVSEFEIVVEDNGVGIPKDKIDLIFEEFGQVDKSLSRKAEGSGIGLSIVKNLIELHDGSIKVKSEENKGTQFIITIPIKSSIKDSYQEDKRIYNTEEKISIEFSDIYY